MAAQLPLQNNMYMLHMCMYIHVLCLQFALYLVLTFTLIMVLACASIHKSSFLLFETVLSCEFSSSYILFCLALIPNDLCMSTSIPAFLACSTHTASYNLKCEHSLVTYRISRVSSLLDLIPLGHKGCP